MEQEQANLTEIEITDKLVSDLLTLKRKLISELQKPEEITEKEEKKEEKETKNKKKRKKKKDIMDNILDDGGFVISDEEEKESEDDEEDRKSVSTNASLNNAFMNFNGGDNLYNQRVFSNPKTKIFCEEASTIIQEFQKKITGNGMGSFGEDNNFSFKVDEDLLNFLYTFFVVNKIEDAEIEIFFSFCSNLVDVSL